jgi:hypothetical protein
MKDRGEPTGEFTGLLDEVFINCRKLLGVLRARRLGFEIDSKSQIAVWQRLLVDVTQLGE